MHAGKPHLWSSSALSSRSHPRRTSMPYLNRDSFIALLDRLGSTDDAEVLASAREIDRRMRASGVSWNDLLVPPPADMGDGLKDGDGYRGAFTDDDLLDIDPPRRAGGY